MEERPSAAQLERLNKAISKYLGRTVIAEVDDEPQDFRVVDVQLNDYEPDVVMLRVSDGIVKIWIEASEARLA